MSDTTPLSVSHEAGPCTSVAGDIIALRREYAALLEAHEALSKRLVSVRVKFSAALLIRLQQESVTGKADEKEKVLEGMYAFMVKPTPVLTKVLSEDGHRTGACGAAAENQQRTMRSARQQSELTVYC